MESASRNVNLEKLMSRAASACCAGQPPARSHASIPLPPMSSIHPTATLSPDTQLGSDVQIGPYCVISGKVTLGDGVRLFGNNYIQGPVAVGAGTIVYPFACIGYEPQDVKFKPGQATPGVVIGKE